MKKSNKTNKELFFEAMKKANPDFIIKEDVMLEATFNPSRLDALTRKKINRELSTLPNYHQSIPMDLIENILEKYGLLILQEDHTPYEGFFLGAEGRAELELGYLNTARQEDNITFYTPIENSMLILTWYKMQSGKYEIVSYVS